LGGGGGVLGPFLVVAVGGEWSRVAGCAVPKKKLQKSARCVIDCIERK